MTRYNELYYKVYSIPKKNGAPRLIAQPSRALKAIQAWILGNILFNLKTSSACKGFEKGTSIRDNASPHCDANFIFSIDFEDFFPTIKANQVYSIFYALGYNKKISSLLATLCTYKGFLPQGSPCSPKLSNLICIRLDSRLQGYVGNKGIIYTRYADDLSFSSLAENRILKAIKTIKKIIVDEGFKIKESKTRIVGPSRQKKITGLIISDNGRVGIGRDKYKLIRAKLNHLTLEKAGEKKDSNEIASLNGLISYVHGVDKKRYAMLKSYIKKIGAKYPDSLISEIKIDYKSVKRNKETQEI